MTRLTFREQHEGLFMQPVKYCEASKHARAVMGCCVTCVRGPACPWYMEEW
jgi:hypothetical protein